MAFMMEQVTVSPLTLKRIMLSSATTLLLMTSTIRMVDCQSQSSTACTISMMSSITPCANFITGSTNNNNNNAATPSTTCCDSLRSLMSSSMDCACMLISNLQRPITQAIAMSLSRACNINGVVQCKAPGTMETNNGTLPPTDAESPLSPQGSRGMDAGRVQKYQKRQLAVAMSDDVHLCPRTFLFILMPIIFMLFGTNY
ncbi:hypothetical protein PIB30_031893 [Stylosanthes scabra]|uniref:Bifunctional inhibitor/plant lipid transfer protein/seed storage helical domain-containing protein n=1 Tax=Stylosanthes scabra TaxID=79078 RepID=A0ABU6XDQ8_9FABA|nr:hypothetical protein [Stylosanthes scabra]